MFPLPAEFPAPHAVAEPITCTRVDATVGQPLSWFETTNTASIPPVVAYGKLDAYSSSHARAPYDGRYADDLSKPR